MREVGYSAIDILSANTNGGFCSPIGFTPQNPANSAYQTVFDARRADLAGTPGSGAFFPRIPRYGDSVQQQKRVGGSLTLQYRPDDRTDVRRRASTAGWSCGCCSPPWSSTTSTVR